jgi:hypothetical protein
MKKIEKEKKRKNTRLHTVGLALWLFAVDSCEMQTDVSSSHHIIHYSTTPSQKAPPS